MDLKDMMLKFPGTEKQKLTSDDIARADPNDLRRGMVGENRTCTRFRRAFENFGFEREVCGRSNFFYYRNRLERFTIKKSPRRGRVGGFFVKCFFFGKYFLVFAGISRKFRHILFCVRRIHHGVSKFTDIYQSCPFLCGGKSGGNALSVDRQNRRPQKAMPFWRIIFAPLRKTKRTTRKLFSIRSFKMREVSITWIYRTQVIRFTSELWKKI